MFIFITDHIVEHMVLKNYKLIHELSICEVDIHLLGEAGHENVSKWIFEGTLSQNSYWHIGYVSLGGSHLCVENVYSICI